MLKAGLTGGIGCGKSTAVNTFRVLGAAIIDADEISKDLVKAGTSTLLEMTKAFGNDLLLPNGDLNRLRLKEVVFSDSTSLDKLEAIIHPKVRAEIDRQIATLSGYSYVIVDVPLLVEKNYIGLFDRIIVVDCLPEQQIARVNQRDDIDETIIKAIMKKQVSREIRLKAATDILDNFGEMKILEAQVKKLHYKLLTMPSTQGFNQT